MNTHTLRNEGVSEILGAILLIAVISLAVSIVGVTILSNIDTSQIPAVSFVITNQSRNITILHNGGDPLAAGSYRIYIDEIDRTGSFSPSPGTTIFNTGTLLYSDGSFLPSGQNPHTAMVIYRGSEGKEVVLVQKFFA